MQRHLAFQFGLRGHDIGVVQRHHRHIDRGADGRDDADTRQPHQRHVLGKFDALGIDRVNDQKVDRDLPQHQRALPGA